MSDLGLLIVSILGFLAFCSVLDCISKHFRNKQTPLEDLGWVKTGRMGHFDIYTKRPWYSNKPLELYVWREEK